LDSRNRVDPEIVSVLDELLGFGLTAETLPAFREMSAQRVEMALNTPVEGNQVERTEVEIESTTGNHSIGIVIYQPPSDNVDTRRGCLLHIHGGGYVTGHPDARCVRNRLLAELIDIVIVSVDYRLAPETPHPGPLEDCYSALKWVHENDASLGIDRTRIAVGGESAGGGLAASLALHARDKREIPVAFQLLIYPMLDDRTGSSIPAAPMTGDFVWSAAENQFGWSALLGDAYGKPHTAPYAPAARAENLEGLPPAFVAACELDVLRDEAIDYAKALMQSGVQTELHVYPGTCHAFDMVPEATVSKKFFEDYSRALGRALA